MKQSFHRRGFSLVEVVLSLAIIATAFVALIGVLPAGLGASRDAANSSITGFILESVHQRLSGQPLQAGAPSISPLYFDADGLYIAPDASQADLNRRAYRADIELSASPQPLLNTRDLLFVRIALSWPIQTDSGVAVGAANPRVVVTYPVTSHSGPDWQKIDPQYTPKVEF